MVSLISQQHRPLTSLPGDTAVAIVLSRGAHRWHVGTRLDPR
jgi:hypothetical protein